VTAMAPEVLKMTLTRAKRDAYAAFLNAAEALVDAGRRDGDIDFDLLAEVEAAFCAYQRAMQAWAVS